MVVSHSLFLLLGVALCAVALVQMGLWAATSLQMLFQNRRQFELSRQLMLQQIEKVIEQRVAHGEAAPEASALTSDCKTTVDDFGSWSGYRSFVVEHAVKETPTTTSLYLVPEDGKPIASFRPGQHLTLRFAIPGQAKPVVRCYSLSSGFVASDADSPLKKAHYRITVKQQTTTVTGDAGQPPGVHHGLVSTFINQSLHGGERVEAKAPAGHFWMDEDSSVPIVMCAGGIGVTPMISMLERLRALQVQTNNPTAVARTAVLFYGVRNSAEHAFGQHLESLAASMDNVHVINCYSQPLDSDVPEKQFHVRGFVSIELLRQVLQNNHYQFYLCGPPAFMESLHQGLVDWQVPENRIHSEAFGPASIGKAASSLDSAASGSQIAPVTFVQSGKTAVWDGEHDSLLDLAEASQLFPDSGCRAGSCGSCETGLTSGKVVYPDGERPDCAPGKCLLCTAQPNGAVELEL